MIESYSFGKMKINNIVYTKDLIITPDKIIENCWRKESHRLYEEDIKNVLEDSNPDVLIVGTGKFGLMKIDDSLTALLEQKNIRHYALPSSKAVKLFNRFLEEGIRVTAAFHLTC